MIRRETPGCGVHAQLWVTTGEMEQLKAVLAAHGCSGKVGPECTGDHCGTCEERPREAKGWWAARDEFPSQIDSIEVTRQPPTVTIHEGPNKGVYRKCGREGCAACTMPGKCDEVKRLEHLIEQHKAARKTAEAERDLQIDSCNGALEEVERLRKHMEQVALNLAAGIRE